jgi:UDP-N-acetylmuramyl pentapeptide phosphotransferase/UDP-N-acetylglucosamine-1-phosphate transferase
MILSASKKFVGQLIAAGILIKFGGIQITNMHGFLGIHELPHIAGIIFTVFTIIVITNSFNLIDGVDGLAGSLGLLTSLVFGTYFAFNGNVIYAVIALSLAGSITGFLIYNFSPAKIFMGDTGSLLLGLINSVLVIKFINISGTASSPVHFTTAPAIGFAILIIPLFDTLRVFTLRILDRRSPFSPDRNHVHHFLLDMGFSHRMVTFTCVAANIIFIGTAYFLRNMDVTLLIGILLSSAIVFIGTIYYYSRQRNKSVSRRVMPKADVINSHKRLTLASETASVEVD